MFTKYELILSDDDRATLILAVSTLRKSNQQVLKDGFYPEHLCDFARDIIDSADRLLHIFKESGEVVSDVR